MWKRIPGQWPHLFVVSWLTILLACSPEPQATQVSADTLQTPAIAHQPGAGQDRDTPQNPIEIDQLGAPERQAIYQPERVISALGVQPGDVVADVGAGIGLFSEVLSEAVGEEGRVYATEIDPGKLEIL
ncbi:MAG: hypothetical protein QGG40_16225, partial [Myxococcota bacterium]|nr:hypothetical protein [Myxococcota bacterium]